MKDFYVNKNNLIFLVCLALILAFVFGIFVGEYRAGYLIEYRYIYYSDEKIFDDNIPLSVVNESGDYIIDTIGEELYFSDTDSIVEIEISPVPISITFGNDIGRLSWEDDIMRFEGDADKSAIIFFEYFLRPYIDEYIESGMEKEELTIEEPEQIMYLFTTSFDNYKPQWFLKVVDTDMSRCFINGRLRLNLNGEIYWIRLEKGE